MTPRRRRAERTQAAAQCGGGSIYLSLPCHPTHTHTHRARARAQLCVMRAQQCPTRPGRRLPGHRPGMASARTCRAFRVPTQAVPASCSPGSLGTRARPRAPGTQDRQHAQAPPADAMPSVTGVRRGVRACSASRARSGQAGKQAGMRAGGPRVRHGRSHLLVVVHEGLVHDHHERFL